MHHIDPSKVMSNHPSIDPSRPENPYSYLRTLFLQATEHLSKNSCLIDLSKISASLDSAQRKSIKQFLSIFISEQTAQDSILLKTSNQYPDLLKYALQSGFKFKEANAEFSILTYLREVPSPQISGEYNPKKQTQQQIIIKEEPDNPKVPQAPKMDTSFLKKKMSVEEQRNHRSQIAALNPQQTTHLFSNKPWNIDYYDQENYPVILGTISDQKTFSSRQKGVGLRFLDMPIHMPGQGWRIPPELEQFKEVITRAVAFERDVNPEFEKTCFVYITVDQGEVEPHQAQRRTGWHGDSFLKIDNKKNSITHSCDHVYVIADNCPTPFLPGPFSLKGVDPENIDAVLKHFAQQAEGKTPTYYPNYTLLRLDPYCVHNVGFNNSEQPLFRTFVKISFSQNKYCKLGNARNPLFVYDWPMIPRYQVPYDNSALQRSSHRKDRDQFLEVNPHLIDFSKNTCQLAWAGASIQTAIRRQSVFAEPAREGELLRTFCDGFLATIFAAEKEDWKVTASHGDEYFLSEADLNKLYTKDAEEAGKFNPKPIPRRFIRLTENVRFLAPWGTLQYARKGDVLMCAGKNDVYALPGIRFKDDFIIN